MDRRILEIHLREARTRALRIFSASSTILPTEWEEQYQDLFFLDLSEFSFHARRVNQLTKLHNCNFSNVDVCRYVHTEHARTAPISNYHEALNRISHSEKFIIGYGIWDGPKIHLLSDQNKILMFAYIETDHKKDLATISVYGLSICFLTSVLPAVKSKFPDVQF